ncbi:hypothetical protein ACS0TY_033770 [Phlomoides rotata]
MEFPSESLGKEERLHRESLSATTTAGKAKVWAEQDAGMDELFVILGYKVKSTDMADVAEKLEQLEMAMGSSMEDGVSVLSNDTVHYNPSDLSGWVESMLTEFNQSGGFDMIATQIGISGESFSSNIICFSRDNQAAQQREEKYIYDDDLRAIPGGAIFSSKQKDVVDSESGSKRMKSSVGSEFQDSSPLPPPEVARPVMLVDSQDSF